MLNVLIVSISCIMNSGVNFKKYEEIVKWRIVISFGTMNYKIFYIFDINRYL